MSIKPLAPGQPTDLASPPPAGSPGSPGSLGAAAVTEAAKPALKAAPPSATGASLDDRLKPSKIIHSLLHQAGHEYKKGNLEQARGLYQKTLANYEQFKAQPDSNFIDPPNIPTICYLGIAKSGSDSERPNYIQLASQEIEHINRNKANWDAFNPKRKSLAYRGFKINLENYKSLIPQSQHAEIDRIIENCNEYILPIHSAKYELLKGQELFEQKNIDGARKMYNEALRHTNTVDDTFTAEYRILTTSIYISYAEAYQQEDNERIQHCGAACEQIFYLQGAIQKQPSVNTSEKLLSLCDRLKKLCPDAQYTTFIQPVVEACQKGIEELKKRAPANRGRSRRSGKGPRRQPNYLRLIIVLAFAGLAIFTGVALYRRLITKIE